MDYRDPLFSIIVFLSLISFTILITNFFGYLKQKNKEKHLKEFIEKFNFLNDSEINSIFSNNISTNALLLLAIAFEKEGNYEKSLNIYLVLLENVNSNEKFTILQNMAKVYLKAGFLHKARESLIEILRAMPRNIEALKLLFIVDDKLKNYDEMEEVLEICEELEQEFQKQQLYLEFKKSLFNNDKEKIETLYKSNDILKRNYVTFFIKYDKEKIFKEIDAQSVYEMLDIFWEYDNLPANNEAFIDIKEAKKELPQNRISPIFELQVLKHTPKNLADLEFEYICSECKQVFPFYDDRCPNCGELFCLKVEVNITKMV